MSVKSKTLLDSEWRVRELPGEDVPEHNRLGWLPAQVPGHVHLDLMAAGVLSDLNYRMQERSAQWVDDLDWQYETSFKASPVVGAHTFLLFNGLDTIAEISLNGTLLGTADNMFSTHEFRVDNYLINENDGDGLNVLQVTFRSAKKTGILRQLEWNEGPDAITPHWDNWSHRAMIRKSQYMYGWDWGPVFISCGIWQPVELITVESGRLLDWKYAYELRDERALVTVSTVVERPDPTNTTKLRLVLQLNTDSIEIDVPDAAGRHELSGTLQIENAKLWQPAGLNPPGNQPALYTLRTVLADQAGNILDTRSSTIGLRTIELLHEGGSGAGFQFRINGQPIFVKGANWIPNNSFPAVTNTTGLSSVRERIRQAYDAGFNMLRVWGGGLYETEEFYNACDELGLMVWQDFAYGCSYYPDTGKYARDARIEAVSAVRRIRNHPSLALWCGNNENQTMFHSDWGSLSPHRLVGEGIFHEILPGVVAAESPGIPYWPSSPYGGDDPNSADYGDCHNWDVWHGRGDWVHYVENDSRFCSEFGFASSCGLPAWETILKPTDRSPRSPAVMWHDKTRKGYETYLHYIELHFPKIDTLEDLVYFSQLNQAEALKFGVEHYRRRKGRCWGTLYWQLNDCWPVQSWSVIDFLGEQKAAYYASKKFYSPVLVSLVKEGNVVVAHIVSDLIEPLSGSLELSVVDFDGNILNQLTGQVELCANKSAKVASIDISSAACLLTETFVHAKFAPETPAIHTTIDNILLLCEPKELKPTDSPPIVSVAQSASGSFEITLAAAKFTPYVWLRRSDNLLFNPQDNFFHLRPGETRTINAPNTERQSVEEFQKVLLIQNL